MYKLENDVQWTSNLKEAFKHNVTRAKILYGSSEINEQNNLSRLSLEEQRYISNLGFIGTATARMLELSLVDINGNINLENEEITLKIGADYDGQTYYINYGNFIVDKPPEVDETNGTIRVVAYDYMIKFNKNYQDTITYPCTLKQFLDNVCSQAGVELGSTTFPNQNFIVTDNQFAGMTLREVLQNIAKCAFSWARIGQDNKLYLDFNLTPENTETITIDEYKTNSFKKANEYYGPVNQVTYADSTIEGQEVRVKNQASIDQNGLKEIVIYDNLFAYTPEKSQELIQAGAGIIGLTYMPVSQLDLIGFAYLDCRDMINVETLNGTTYSSRVFNHNITYNGALEDSIITEGTSTNEDVFKNTANNILQNQQTRIIVDKANKVIQSVVEDITEQNNKISRVEQTVDELNSKISDIADITTSQGSGDGRLLFENINQSEPIYINIKPLGENISYLYPRANLYPATDLYIPFRRLRFTNTETDEIFEYELPEDLLYYDSDNYDEFILDYAGGENGIVYINKKCAYDSSGNVVLLPTEEVHNYTFPHAELSLTDGDYTVEILKYEGVPYTAYIFARLMAQNIYTSQFTTKVEVNSQISQTANGIMSIVETKADRDKIISSINQTSEQVKISANKISLEGKTIDLTADNIAIDSTNFQVTKNGNMTCTNANITGNITATSGTFTGDLYMASDKKLASTSEGIMSTLYAAGTGPFNGYEYLGYGLSMESKYQRTSPMVAIYIPSNFTPVYAYLFIEQVQPTFKLDSGNVTGRATATKVRKGSSGPSMELYGFASEYFMNMNALSGTDITNAAFGSSTKVPNVGMTISNNIASQITKGQLNVFSAYITDGTYDNRQATFDGSEQAEIGRITGLAKLSIQVIGYLNPF